MLARVEITIILGRLKACVTSRCSYQKSRLHREYENSLSSTDVCGWKTCSLQQKILWLYFWIKALQPIFIACSCTLILSLMQFICKFHEPFLSDLNVDYWLRRFIRLKLAHVVITSKLELDNLFIIVVQIPPLINRVPDLLTPAPLLSRLCYSIIQFIVHR